MGPSGLEQRRDPGILWMQAAGHLSTAHQPLLCCSLCCFPSTDLGSHHARPFIAALGCWGLQLARDSADGQLLYGSLVFSDICVFSWGRIYPLDTSLCSYNPGEGRFHACTLHYGQSSKEAEVVSRESRKQPYWCKL